MIWCKRVNPLLPVQLVLLMRKKGLLLRRATIPPADFSVKRVAEPLWEGGEGRGREGRKGGGKRRKKEGKRKGREGREGRTETYDLEGISIRVEDEFLTLFDSFCCHILKRTRPNYWTGMHAHAI